MFLTYILASLSWAAPEMIPIEDTDLKGRAAPSFSLPLFEGGTVELEKLRGKPVVLSFWASWCGPCQQYAPHFEQAAKNMRYAAQFLKISTEQEPHLAQQYAVRSIPTTLLIKSGQEVARQAGVMSASQLQQWVGRSS